MNYRTYSHRFGEEILNSKLALKNEILEIITDPSIDIATLSRPNFNETLRSSFVNCGWDDQPLVFGDPGDPSAKLDFLKERVGIEVAFGHASFLGIDLLKMQVSSYSALDKIDAGVYIVTTSEFQKKAIRDYNLKWEGSLNFEKVRRYLPQFKSAIHVPVWVIGIDP